MTKFGNVLLAIVLGGVGFLSLFAQQASAAAAQSCQDNWGINFFGAAPPTSIQGGGSFTFKLDGFVTTKNYKIALQRYNVLGNQGNPIFIGNVSGERTGTFSAAPPSTNISGSYDIKIQDTASGDWCEVGQFQIESSDSCNISVDQGGFSDTYCIDFESGKLTIHVSNIFINGGLANQKIHVKNSQDAFQYNEDAVNGVIPDITFTPVETRVGDTLTIEVSDGEFLGSGDILCTKEFDLIQACDDAARTTPTSDTTFDICAQIPEDSEAYGKCARCVAGQNVNGSGIPPAPEIPLGIWTAVGCIENDPQSIVVVVIRVGMGVAGGVALLMILAASFTISTSQGDAKKTDEGREMITSAVIGLIFIIMSITMLQFIGVSIFRIPGFGDT